MTDIAPAAPAATEAPSAPAPSAPSTSTQSGPATPSQATPEAASTAPPGWSQRDGKWVWKGVVDGQETELDHERAEHFLRTKESGQRRWQEAARLQQQAEAREAQIEEYLASIKSPQGIRQLARDLQLSPREVAEAILAEEMAEANLSPEERELRDLRARDAEYRRNEEQRTRQQREQQIERHKQQFVQRFTGAVNASLERVGGPPNAGARQWITQRTAQLYQDHRENGVGDVHVDDLTKKAIAEYREMAQGAFGDDDLLERVWSNEQLREKMRARYLEAAKPAHPSKPQPKPGPGDLPPRGNDGKFQKLRVDTTASPATFTEQLNELVRHKNGG